MKKTILIYPIIVSVLVLLITTNCKKEESAKLAILSTTAVTNITAMDATSGGFISSDGGAAITARGVCWSTTADPLITDSKTSDGDGSGQFISNFTGLTSSTTYHVRAYATNSVGTAYGADIAFSSLGQAPSSLTLAATNISAAGATLNGTVNAYNLNSIVTFEYGTTTSYGQTVTATESPLIESSNTNVSAIISGLIEATIYHFRVKAVNSIGTIYGSDMTFTTPPLSPVTDIDGNSYIPIRIGTQVWMKENLKTTKYNDGTAIALITDNTAWAALTEGAYCDYDNNPANSTSNGRLYNWYAVDNNPATMGASNGGKNICPTGWHVPSDAEWTTLTDYLTDNGYGYEGSGSDIAKSMAATSGWTTNGAIGTVGNDQASNNISGFTGLPSGARNYFGSYNNVGYVAIWWTSTEALSSTAYNWGAVYNASDISRVSLNMQNGFSVRCVRD